MRGALPRRVKCFIIEPPLSLGSLLPGSLQAQDVVHAKLAAPHVSAAPFHGARVRRCQRTPHSARTPGMFDARCSDAPAATLPPLRRCPVFLTLTYRSTQMMSSVLLSSGGLVNKNLRSEMRFAVQESSVGDLLDWSHRS